MKQFNLKLSFAAILAFAFVVFGASQAHAGQTGLDRENSRSSESGVGARLLPRVVRVVSTATAQGQQVTVSIGADTEGDENAYGFSLNYESAKLSNPIVALGADVPAGSSLETNTNTAGRIGVSLLFPSSANIQRGNNLQLLTIRFTVAANAAFGASPITFGDVPTFRETSNQQAQALPTTFEDGAVNVRAPRVVRVASTTGVRGQPVTVSINADTLGDENAYGFSINYESAKLSSPIVALGSGVPAGSSLETNTNTAGRIGVSLLFPSNMNIAAGTNRELITVRFTVAANAPSGTSPIAFGDVPTFRETSNQQAQALPTSFEDGAVTIRNVITAASVPLGGKIFNQAGRALSGVTITLLDSATGESLTAITDRKGRYSFVVEAGKNYLLTPSYRNHRFTPNAEVIAHTGTREDVNFIGVGIKRVVF